MGLNDGEDEQCKWLKVGRDMQELCRRKPGSRLSVAQQVCRDRDGNVVSDGSSARSSQLLGREGLRERQALGQIKSIQSLAAQSAQSHRQVEADMFQVRPSKLVAPSQGSPASMFEPSTWAMAFRWSSISEARDSHGCSRGLPIPAHPRGAAVQATVRVGACFCPFATMVSISGSPGWWLTICRLASS